MKISESEITKVSKILSKINYHPMNKSAYFFMPVEINCINEVDGLTINNSSKHSDAEMAVPGVVLMSPSDDKKHNDVLLGYADIRYSPCVDTQIFMKLTSSGISKKDMEYIRGYELYLIKEPYMYSAYRI